MSVPYTRELACLVHRDLHGHLRSRRCPEQPLGEIGFYDIRCQLAYFQ